MPPVSLADVRAANASQHKVVMMRGTLSEIRSFVECVAPKITVEVVETPIRHIKVSYGRKPESKPVTLSKKICKKVSPINSTHTFKRGKLVVVDGKTYSVFTLSSNPFKS